MTSAQLTERIDAAIAIYVLEKGRRPHGLQMCHDTFKHGWNEFAHKKVHFEWRGIPIFLRSMPVGEVIVL